MKVFEEHLMSGTKDLIKKWADKQLEIKIDQDRVEYRV